MEPAALRAIRQNLQQNIGRPVELLSSNRRKLHSRTGVLEGAYASVFTVVVSDEEGELRVSYTYTDVLTQSVRIRALG